MHDTHAFSEATTWKRSETHRIMSIGMPKPREEQVVQLGRGDPVFRSMRLRGREIFCNRLYCKPKLSIMIDGHPDWIGFIVPIRWKGDYSVNGVAALRGDAFLVSGRQTYQTLTEERDAMMIPIRAERFAASCAAFLGCEPDSFRFSPRRFPAIGDTIARLVLANFTSVDDPLADRGCFILSAGQEADLIDEIARLVIEHDGAQERLTARRSDPRRIVHSALDAAHEAGGSSFGVSQMCAAAGVARTRLHQCFIDVYGIAPAKFLRQARLNQARERLLDEECPPRSIKDVALGLGFRNSGRFAAAYREMFGESPMDTLKTAHDRPFLI